MADIQKTPRQIIGDDAYMQLVFEGYEVVKADELSRLREVERKAVEVMHEIAEFNSEDSTTLGALYTLAKIRRAARAFTDESALSTRRDGDG